MLSRSYLVACVGKYKPHGVEQQVKLLQGLGMSFHCVHATTGYQITPTQHVSSSCMTIFGWLQWLYQYNKGTISFLLCETSAGSGQDG